MKGNTGSLHYDSAGFKSNINISFENLILMCTMELSRFTNVHCARQLLNFENVLEQYMSIFSFDLKR
jgi:hypothetical protein